MQTDSRIGMRMFLLGTSSLNPLSLKASRLVITQLSRLSERSFDQANIRMGVRR